MPKLDLTRALRIKTAAGELQALKGSGFAWTKPSAVPGTVARLGYDTVAIGDTSLPGGDGRLFMSRHVMPRPGLLRRVWLYSTSTGAGLVKGVAYADDEGQPSPVRLGVGAPVAVAQNGWVASECAGQALPASAIWIGGITQNFQASLFADDSGGEGWAQWGNANYSDPAAPPGGGPAGYRVLAFIEYEY